MVLYILCINFISVAPVPEIWAIMWVSLIKGGVLNKRENPMKFFPLTHEEKYSGHLWISRSNYRRYQGSKTYFKRTILIGFLEWIHLLWCSNNCVNNSIIKMNKNEKTLIPIFGRTSCTVYIKEIFWKKMAIIFELTL